MTTYGYHAKKGPITNRLNRLEGQVRGVTKMVQDDKYCIDILTQIAAVQSALDKVSLELLTEHARHCLADEGINAKSREKKAEELVQAVSRML